MAASSPAAPPKPSAPAAPAAPPPLSGELLDQGMVRHDAVRVLTWTARGGGTKVLGDVEVGVAQLDGLISIRGKLRARRLELRGSLELLGTADVAESFTVHGSSVLGTAVSAGTLELNGPSRVGGDIKVAGGARWKGNLEVAGALSADAIDFEGSLAATGDVVAKSLVGRLKGTSKIGNLRASKISFQRTGMLPMLRSGALTALRIDADEVHLEGVTVQFVKAENITVGPGCHVAQIEGRLLSTHPSSHVGPESRTPRPYGLSR